MNTELQCMLDELDIQMEVIPVAITAPDREPETNYQIELIRHRRSIWVGYFPPSPSGGLPTLLDVMTSVLRAAGDYYRTDSLADYCDLKGIGTGNEEAVQAEYAWCERIYNHLEKLVGKAFRQALIHTTDPGHDVGVTCPVDLVLDQISAQTFMGSKGADPKYAVWAAEQGLVPNAVPANGVWYAPATESGWEYWWTNYPTGVLSMSDLHRELNEIHGDAGSRSD